MTAPPPIKVRFESDGQSAVVGAIDEVGAALKRAGAAGKSAATGASQVASGNAGLATSFRQLAAAVGVVQLARFVTSAVEAADAIGKMAQAVGISSEKMSVLAFAAQQADVDTGILRVGLKGLTKSLTDLQNGSAPAVAAFRALGLSAKDLQGLSVDQAFKRIADAQARFADGAGKAAAAQVIFGRSGGQLIPLLNDLAGNGLANATAEATRLGVVFSDQATRDADAFTDQLGKLKAAAQGLAVQFGLGLAPSVTETVALITDKTGEIGSAASGIGRFIGAIIRTVVAVFEGAGQIIATTVALVITGTRTIGTALALAATGHFKDAAEATRQGVGEIRSILATDTEEFSKLGDFLFGNPDDAANQATAAAVAAAKATRAEKARQQVILDQQSEAGRAAQLQAEQKAADDALKLQQHAFDNELKAAQSAYQQGLTSLESFFAERRRIINANADAQLAAIAAKQALVGQEEIKTEADRQKQRGELAALESQRQDVLIQKQGALNALVGEEANERKRLTDAVRSLDQQLLIAQGRQADADRAALQASAEQARRTLTQAGDANAGVKVDQFLQLGEAKIALDELGRQATVTFGDIDREVARTAELVQSGAISEAEGQRRIIALQRERLPVLAQIRAQYEALLATTTDPTQRAAIEDQIAKIDNLVLSVVSANNIILKLGATARDALQQGLGDGIKGLIEHTESLADAWRNTARAVVSAIDEIISKLIAQLIVQQLVNAASGIFGLGGGGGGGGSSAGTAIRALAAGGPVSGPGGPTSDSIPAYLSNGEYVVRAAAVAAVGVDTLDAINGMRRGIRSFGPARFADGGPVDGAARGGMSFQGTIGLEDGLVGKHIDSKGSDDALVRWATRNRKTLSSLLK